MSDDLEFAALVARVRAGDPDAAAEFVRRYEPEVRRVVRARLTDPAMRRELDTMDVAQSVLAAFFVRVGAGAFDLDSPGGLLALLTQMVRNRLRNHHRRVTAEKRDKGRQVAGSGIFDGVAGAGPTPSRDAAARELLAEVRRRLSPDERHVAEQRQLGRNWAEIAAELGRNAEAVRKQFERAVARVATELGLDDEPEGGP